MYMYELEHHKLKSETQPSIIRVCGSQGLQLHKHGVAMELHIAEAGQQRA